MHALKSIILVALVRFSFYWWKKMSAKKKKNPKFPFIGQLTWAELFH
jgi:hypothetical protein